MFTGIMETMLDDLRTESESIEKKTEHEEREKEKDQGYE
jgi:hypothetical protein